MRYSNTRIAALILKIILLVYSIWPALIVSCVAVTEIYTMDSTTYMSFLETTTGPNTIDWVIPVAVAVPVAIVVTVVVIVVAMELRKRKKNPYGIKGLV